MASSSPPTHPYFAPRYVIAAVAVSLGGLLNGYDTGSIGAITHMQKFTESVGQLSASMLGITVSIIMLTGTLPSLFAGHFADKFGRITIIIPGAILFGVGALVQGLAHGLAQFTVGRAIAGFGQGVFLSNINVYICEIAPMRWRGTLTGLPQFMATAGVCAGYFTCYGTVNLQSDLAWRVPYILQCAFSAVLAWSCLLLPDSPRWLMLQGRQADARRALERLDFNMAEAERDFLMTTEQSPSLTPWQGMALLFKRGYRARTILALFILGMVQLSGIDGVLYYAPILFEQAGISSENASFLASGLSSILMLLISIPAFLLADKWGRRTSAISGGIALAACMFLMGSLYAADAVHPYGVARWFVIIAVFVFSLTYCATWGIVGKIYASEIQPGHTRAAANCVAMGLCFGTNFLVAICTPILLEASAFGAYFLFGGLAMATVAVLALYMPETRGRSLENIQEAFHRPSAVSSLTQLLQPLGFGARRRTHQTAHEPTAGEETELEPIDATEAVAASAISVEAVPRALRLDVSV
ncbi:putative MFS sugar transporter [Daldinia caldariorum]|uniref:putative MFS sugar transporter n=1 Tax=Daldinia caldariorum TaxID=326644 RepID=UPI0020082EE6|nr:putative MFS sugar transporter [Daldinia caldariorum]KAI1463019.1 putative MFS sugar transporter [Daldinia caldariorum]